MCGKSVPGDFCFLFWRQVSSQKNTSVNSRYIVTRCRFAIRKTRAYGDRIGNRQHRKGKQSLTELVMNCHVTYITLFNGIFSRSKERPLGKRSRISASFEKANNAFFSVPRLIPLIFNLKSISCSPFKQSLTLRLKADKNQLVCVFCSCYFRIRFNLDRPHL